MPSRSNVILLVGAGRMGGALLRGWLSAGLRPLIVVEPNPPDALRTIAQSGDVAIHSSVAEVDTSVGVCVVALKPQVLAREAPGLRRFAENGALMVSIAAGTRIASLRDAWGERARIVRAMPNTPGSIGRGISALFAPAGVAAEERSRAESLLAGLGPSVWVTSEDDIDIVTAVSGSGPAYVYLLVEALAEAGIAEGLPKDVAQQLARATVSGAGALLDADRRAPSELRRDVTSPGGTTEAALAVLLSDDGLKSLLARAVSAARRRAGELSGR